MSVTLQPGEERRYDIDVDVLVGREKWQDATVS
jgi:hypothetical protein